MYVDQIIVNFERFYSSSSVWLDGGGGLNHETTHYGFFVIDSIYTILEVELDFVVQFLI